MDSRVSSSIRAYDGSGADGYAFYYHKDSSLELGERDCVTGLAVSFSSFSGDLEVSYNCNLLSPVVSSYVRTSVFVNVHVSVIRKRLTGALRP
jgi:hypothetical protein